MKLGLGLYRQLLNRETLRFARQAGVTHIVAHLPGHFVREDSKIITSDQAAYGFGVSEADDPIWTAKGLRDLKALVNGEGLELEALENFAPAHWHDVLLDGPRRAEQMAHLKQILRNVGGAGIRTMGYSFTIAGVWGRTEGPFARGGARSVGFGNPVQTPIPAGMVWNMVYDPNRFHPNNPTETVGIVSAEEIWRRFSEFLCEMMPVAEELGVKLAQVALSYGADDLHGTVVEDDAAAASGDVVNEIVSGRGSWLHAEEVQRPELRHAHEPPEVRQALSYAINRGNIIDGVLLGIGRPCTGPYSDVSWAYNPHAKSYEYDPGRARRMLAEAGWEDVNDDGILEKNGKPFRFTIMTNQGNSERIHAAEIMQQNLKAVGIDVNIRVMEWQAFLEQIDKRSFDAMILGWSMSRDPDLYDIWHSSKTRKGEYNFIGYKNPEVDRLLVQGRRIFDVEKRKKIYYRIHEILSEEQPYAFLYVPDATPIVHKRFKGIVPAPLGIFYNFREWYVPQNRMEW